MTSEHTSNGAGGLRVPGFSPYPKPILRLPEEWRKVAVCGTSRTWNQAPFNDPTWVLVGSSPGLRTAPPPIKGWGAWLECHDLPTVEREEEEYFDFLTRLQCPLYTFMPHPKLPQALPWPRKEMEREHGRFFLKSSIAWWIAALIDHPELTDLGLWGFDATYGGEYEEQRKDIWHYFSEVRRHRGTRIHVPALAEFLLTEPTYPDQHPKKGRITARRRELEAAEQNRQGTIDKLEEALASQRRGLSEIHGAKETLDDLERNLCGEFDPIFLPSSD